VIDPANPLSIGSGFGPEPAPPPRRAVPDADAGRGAAAVDVGPLIETSGDAAFWPFPAPWSEDD
jgi:hypothetical protein